MRRVRKTGSGYRFSYLMKSMRWGSRDTPIWLRRATTGIEVGEVKRYGMQIESVCSGAAVMSYEETVGKQAPSANVHQTYDVLQWVIREVGETRERERNSLGRG
jgi:hypothetical protein